MGIFDFGKRQKLHTQMIGNTSGREMFKVDEYNQLKRITFSLAGIMMVLFTIFYFAWDYIPTKIKVFMGLIFVGCATWEYFNVKHQIRVRESLYKE